MDPRQVPRTDTLLADPQLAAAGERLGRALVKAAVQRVQQRIRAGEVAPADAVDAVLGALPTTRQPAPVLNATGVLVHTNLGRAPLSAAAVEAVVAAGHDRRRAGPRHRPPRPPGRGRARRAAGRRTGRRGRAGGQQLRGRTRARRHRARCRAASSSSPAASWSRSATASASPSCSPPPAPGCTRSGRRTGSPSPTTRRARPGHRRRAQGAPVELRGPWVHPRGRGGRARAAWPVSAFRWSPTSAPACSAAPAAARRAGSADHACRRRRPRPGQRRQAARRPTGRPGARPRRRSSQRLRRHPLYRALRVDKIDARRAGGDAARPAAAGPADARRRPGRRCVLEPRALAAAAPRRGRRGRGRGRRGAGRRRRRPGHPLASAAVALPPLRRAAAAVRRRRWSGAWKAAGRLLNLRSVARRDDALLPPSVPVAAVADGSAT